VGSEAGKRLKELLDTVDSSGRLSNEEMEEINRIVAEHTGAGGVLVAPDLDMLGVTNHLKFFEHFGYIAQDAEEAYQAGWFLEAISLRLLTFDFLLRIYVVHKTKQPVKPSIQFGQLLGKAKGQGFPQKLAAELEAFNEKRISSIHHYLLGRLTPRAKEVDTIIGREASAALQGLSVGGCTFHVGFDTTSNVCGLLVANVFDTLGRNSDDQTTRREFLILRHQSAGGHDGAFAYLRAVEDRGAHPDETAVSDLAAVHNGPVADDAVVSHESRVARVGVQDAAVLDVGAGPDPDRLCVPPQHGPVPDARLLP
jgi:hypothetical protein